MCRKCWSDSYNYHDQGYETQTDKYTELVKSRDCTPKEQAGEYWDEETQRDTRLDSE